MKGIVNSCLFEFFVLKFPKLGSDEYEKFFVITLVHSLIYLIGKILPIENIGMNND